MNYEPKVSVIVAVRNEDKNVERRIRDLASQHYPKDKLEIIVVSDGSNDNTNIIVERLIREPNDRTMGHNSFLRLLSYESIRGKAYALNMGVANANGEIIVFADCRQRFFTFLYFHLFFREMHLSFNCLYQGKEAKTNLFKNLL